MSSPSGNLARSCPSSSSSSAWLERGWRRVGNVVVRRSAPTCWSWRLRWGDPVDRRSRPIAGRRSTSSSAFRSPAGAVSRQWIFSRACAARLRRRSISTPLRPSGTTWKPREVDGDRVRRRRSGRSCGPRTDRGPSRASSRRGTAATSSLSWPAMSPSAFVLPLISRGSMSRLLSSGHAKPRSHASRPTERAHDHRHRRRVAPRRCARSRGDASARPAEERVPRPRRARAAGPLVGHLRHLGHAGRARDGLSESDRSTLQTALRDQACRMRNLAEQLLDLSRFDLAAVHIRPERVRLRPEDRGANPSARGRPDERRQNRGSAGPRGRGRSRQRST